MFGRKLPRTRLIWIAATIVAVLAVSGGAFVAFRSSIDTVPFSTFLQDVEANRVRAVRVEGNSFAFERRDGTRFETLAPEAYIASTPSFVPGLVARGVRFDVGRSAMPSGSSAALAFTLLASGLLVFFVFRQQLSGRVPSFEKLQAIDPEGVAVTFSEVAVVDEAKDEEREIVAFL